ncbi:MAG: hypothetical protein V3V61_03745 [Gammaproteobacteria bacterium]
MTKDQENTHDPVIDHEARSMARSALDKLSSHEKFCEERNRRADAFEAEMKRGLARIHQRMDETEKTRADQRVIEAKEQAKLQTRTSIMWAGLTFILVFGLKYIVP